MLHYSLSGAIHNQLVFILQTRDPTAALIWARIQIAMHRPGAVATVATAAETSLEGGSATTTRTTVIESESENENTDTSLIARITKIGTLFSAQALGP